MQDIYLIKVIKHCKFLSFSPQSIPREYTKVSESSTRSKIFLQRSDYDKQMCPDIV